MLKPADIEPLKGTARRKVWGLVMASALFMTLSQPPFDVPLVGLFMLAPLLVALPRLTPRASWLAGFAVGMPYFWINMWWLGQMVTDEGNEWIVFGMFAFVATAMSMYYGVATLMIRWLLTRRVRHTLWLVPLAWLGMEFVHEFNTPAPYPWLPVGVSITEFTWFIQTADIWGQYGLSAGLVLTSLGIAALVQLDDEGRFKLRREPLYRFVVPGVAALFVILSCVYGVVRIGQIEALEVDDGPVIAGVQGNLSQEVKVREDPNRIPDSFNTHLRLSQQAAEEGAELICWAETMLFFGATRDGLTRGNEANSALAFRDGIPDYGLLGGSITLPNGRLHQTSYVEYLRAKIAHEYQVPMLVGVLTDVPEAEQIHAWKEYHHRKYNTAMYFDAKGRTVDSYDKRYLVPGGEYIPLEGFGPVRALIEGYSEGLQGYTSRVEPGLRLTTFHLPAKAERLKGRDWAFTSSICYEYAWPICYIELHERPDRYPDFHVNISNEGWFKRSAELDQAVDFCRLRAIESRVPMVRATNTGITCHIDACGRVREVLRVNGDDREVEGLLLMRPAVLSAPQSTIFVSMVGRGLGWLSLLVVGTILPLMLAGRLHRAWRIRRARVAESRATRKIEK